MKRNISAAIIFGAILTGCGEEKPKPATTLTAPGVSVQVNPDGSSSVTVPGVSVNAGPSGGNVSAPGVEVKVTPKP